MASPASGEKAMSARLLTMKFMQRGAASPQTPPSNGTSGPPSKRMRLSTDGASPATPSSALREAMEAEERQRIKALEKHSEALGETRWVLGVQEKPLSTPTTGFAVVTAGFGDIDALESDVPTEPSHSGAYNTDAHAADGEEVHEVRTTGRKVFGRLKRALPEGAPATGSGSDVTPSESDSSADDDDPAAQLIRAERKAATARIRERLRAERKEKRAELDRLAEGRRKKEVKLNRLTSISGGGGLGSRSGSSTPSKDIRCYRCGQKGHTKAQCPQS